MTAAQPTVQSAITAFTQAVNSATSMTQLLANPAFMNVLLTANGMSDQIGYTALATQALTSNLSDPNSLVNQLTDTRWKTLAQNYNFSSTGLAVVPEPGDHRLDRQPLRDERLGDQPGSGHARAVQRAGVQGAGFNDHLGRSDPRRSDDAHRRHHRARHSGTDRLPGPQRAGTGDQHPAATSRSSRTRNSSRQLRPAIPDRQRRQRPRHPRPRPHQTSPPWRSRARACSPDCCFTGFKRSSVHGYASTSRPMPTRFASRAADLIDAGRIDVARPLLAAARALGAAVARTHLDRRPHRFGQRRMGTGAGGTGQRHRQPRPPIPGCANAGRICGDRWATSRVPRETPPRR